MSEPITIRSQKAPFPWFGGKSAAAEEVWTALGDVEHYVEPFAGSLAVLLMRPHPANRAYYSETVNDMDGLVVNAWRSIQLSPDATADAASWPVAEADVLARHCALVKWKNERQLEHLMGDPAFHDPIMAGWWLYGIACKIGGGWCSGDGPWWPDETGRLVKRGRGISRELPHLASDGQGVNHAGLREPGISRALPHLGDDGRGVNHAGLREPGISRGLPHLGNDGQGVNAPQLRKLGIDQDTEPHPVTMPELARWFRFLAARLRHVRICNGDWRRVVTKGAAWTIPVRMADGVAGIFLDPPYADTADRDPGLYASESLTVAHDAREWALSVGAEKGWRIVFAGYDGEHGTAFTDAGWREVEWFKKGFLTGGMGNTNKSKGVTHQQRRERLWCSPHCLHPVTDTRKQGSLWAT